MGQGCLEQLWWDALQRYKATHEGGLVEGSHARKVEGGWILEITQAKMEVYQGRFKQLWWDVLQRYKVTHEGESS